jgi:hypothetical protein
MFSSVQFSTVQSHDVTLAMPYLTRVAAVNFQSADTTNPSTSSPFFFLAIPSSLFDPPSQHSEPQPYDPAQQISISASELNTKVEVAVVTNRDFTSRDTATALNSWSIQ